VVYECRRGALSEREEGWPEKRKGKGCGEREAESQQGRPVLPSPLHLIVVRHPRSVEVRIEKLPGKADGSERKLGERCGKYANLGDKRERERNGHERAHAKEPAERYDRRGPSACSLPSAERARPLGVEIGERGEEDSFRQERREHMHQGQGHE